MWSEHLVPPSFSRLPAYTGMGRITTQMCTCVLPVASLQVCAAAQSVLACEQSKSFFQDHMLNCLGAEDGPGDLGFVPS
jgi:hypothetical protein